MKPIYWGLFLIKNIKGQLPTVPNQHVTFGFKTEMPQMPSINDIYNITVVGYGCNGTNEGFQVEIPSELEKFYNGANIKHITVGVANGGKPVNTATLSFEKIESFTVQAKLGYFQNGKVHFMN